MLITQEIREHYFDIQQSTRSVFIEFTPEVAGVAIAKLQGQAIVPFVVYGITLFGEGEATVASVYFGIFLEDSLSPEGRAAEDKFIAAAKALGGEYTGS